MTSSMDTDMAQAAPHFAPAARDGQMRVNSTDYDGDIVIEQYGYWNGGLGWAVPAWEEWGHADLAGPFATIGEANRALRSPR